MSSSKLEKLSASLKQLEDEYASLGQKIYDLRSEVLASVTTSSPVSPRAGQVWRYEPDETLYLLVSYLGSLHAHEIGDIYQIWSDSEFEGTQAGFEYVGLFSELYTRSKS
jgi:hypothetical protein